MRSFPILWQLTHRRNHISVNAHTEFRFLLLSFTPEQRAPRVINQLASETQLEREAGQVSFIQRCGLRVLVWLTFPSVRTVYLSVLFDYFYKAFGYCVLVHMRQIDIARKNLYMCVFGCVFVWSSYLWEAAHVDHNEQRRFHGDLTQLVERELPILSRHHNVIQSS